MAEVAEIIVEPPAIPPSLWHAYDASVSQHGGKPAITAMHQAPDHLQELLPPGRTAHETGWLSWTYDDLKHATLKVAAGMLAAGVSRGDILATFIPNGIEHVLYQWVAAVLQLTLSHLDPTMVAPGRHEQLQEYLSRVSANIVVAWDAAGAESIDTALHKSQINVKLRFLATDAETEGWTSLKQLAVSSDVPEATITDQDFDLENDGERNAAIFFTSGTTAGRSKGAFISVRSLLIGSAVNQNLFYNTPLKFVGHTVNFRGIMFMASNIQWANSGEIILPGATFSPSTTLDAIEHAGAQGMICVPVQIRLFGQDPTIKSRDLSALKGVYLGGDLVTIDVLEAARRTFPNAVVDTGHGMTEGWGMLGWRYYDHPHPTVHHSGILGVGAPGPGSYLRIQDEAGHTLKRGEAGELHLGGPLVTQSYLGDEQPETFYQDQHGMWLKTGDRALIDDTGAVYIIGRIKDIIKKTGISLSPVVIESVLNATEGIHACVVGVPHVEHGEVPVAVLKQDHDREEVKKIVLDKLGAEHALDGVVTLTELGLEDFPINPTGKVKKFELREKYQQLVDGHSVKHRGQ